MVTLLANFEEKLDVQNVEENMYMVNVNKMLYSNVVIVVAIIVQLMEVVRSTKRQKMSRNAKLFIKFPMLRRLRKLKWKRKVVA